MECIIRTDTLTTVGLQQFTAIINTKQTTAKTLLDDNGDVVNMHTRLTLFTTCVSFIRYDVYDRTRVPARWSIKLSHTWPFSSIFSSPWPLHSSSLLKHIYKHTEGFMKYTLTHAAGERCGEPL